MEREGQCCAGRTREEHRRSGEGGVLPRREREGAARVDREELREGLDKPRNPNSCYYISPIGGVIWALGGSSTFTEAGFLRGRPPKIASIFGGMPFP